MLERLRFRAVALLNAGYSPTVVARTLHVSAASVSQWKRVYGRDGPKGLKAKPHHGPKPKLNDRQRKKLAALLSKGPRKQGFSTDLWTLSRVAEMIQRQFGVTYHVSGVWYVLRGIDPAWETAPRHIR